MLQTEFGFSKLFPSEIADRLSTLTAAPFTFEEFSASFIKCLDEQPVLPPNQKYGIIFRITYEYIKALQANYAITKKQHLNAFLLNQYFNNAVPDGVELEIIPKHSTDEYLVKIRSFNPHPKLFVVHEGAEYPYVNIKELF